MNHIIIFAVSADGRAFGELALLSEDCIRTASIIADEATDLIIVNKDLYVRSMELVMRQVSPHGPKFYLFNFHVYGSFPRA